MKLNNKKLIKESLILSLPGFISIIISLISIPIHLNIAGTENYGNYIVFHFLLIFTNVLNLGIGKSIVISINNFPKYGKEISFEGVKYTAYLFLMIIFILIFMFFLSLNFSYSFYIFNIDSIILILGSVTTLWFLTLEGIFQGNEKFKLLSFFNFLFYSLSLSFPSLLLVKYKNLNFDELIYIALIIKFISVILMLIYIIFNNYLKRSKSSFLYKNLSKNSKWISLNLILVQFYDLIDKIFIKYFYGPIALATYSIPQQLTGKLSILSKGISTFLLPYFSKKNIKKNNLNFSLNIFLFYIPLVIFITFPFYEFFLSLWLGDQLNTSIILLSKIFSISVIFACTSHILVTKFEADKKLNLNLKIELLILPVFLFILLTFIKLQYSLIIISVVILTKEFILLAIRLFLLKNSLINYNKYFLLLITYLVIMILSFYNIYLFYFSLLIILFVNLKIRND